MTIISFFLGWIAGVIAVIMWGCHLHRKDEENDERSINDP